MRRLIAAALVIAAAMGAWAAGAQEVSGRIACAMNPGQAMGSCAYRVEHGADGRATVIVTFAAGFARRLSFEDGAFVRGDTTMSGTGTDTDWRVEGDTHIIRVDDQRFELPVSALGTP